MSPRDRILYAIGDTSGLEFVTVNNILQNIDGHSVDVGTRQRTQVHTPQYLQNPIKAKAGREIDLIIVCKTDYN